MPHASRRSDLSLVISMEKGAQCGAGGRLVGGGRGKEIRKEEIVDGGK